MEHIVAAILVILFETSSPSGVLWMLLYIIGLWKILTKSGLRGFWALIPGARDYQLARCAGRESEGKIYSLTGVGMILLNLTGSYLTRNMEYSGLESVSPLVIVNGLALLMLLLVRLIYHIRVWSGLISVYGVKKR